VFNRFAIRDKVVGVFVPVFSCAASLGYICTQNKAYVGLSIPNFIESNRYDDNEVAILKKKNKLLFDRWLYT
jgi:hypothetical protein